MSTRRPVGTRRTVIQGKLLVPSLPERFVERPRLDALIDELLRAHRFLAVVATPGAGKTTAVSQAVRRRQEPVAWLTLDDTEIAPGRLLTYLEASIAAQIPEATDAASDALASGIPHREAAGLLMEAVGDRSLLIVLDDLERLGDVPEAADVISSLLRYAPADVKIVLISRREVPLEISAAMFAQVAAVGEADLAFTTDEAGRALDQAGATGVEPASAVLATDGWVTGVLFEAWRSAEHVVGLGGEADPLHGYLSSQILEPLAPQDREFLVTTAILDCVSAARAEALGLQDAGSSLERLRRVHLPATWQAEGRELRCHTRFREYLLERLERRGDYKVRALRTAHGRLLLEEGYIEDAVEEFLRASALDEARPLIERSLGGVVERLDYSVAERWLSAVQPDVSDARAELAIGELMLAIGQQQYWRGAAVGDRLAEGGALDEMLRGSGRAACMLAWCYWHVGRLADARGLAAKVAAGQDQQVLLYLLSLCFDDVAEARGQVPPLTGGPLDALVARMHWAHGHFDELQKAPASRWAAAAAHPLRVTALLAIGETERAAELAQSEADFSSLGWLSVMAGVELLAEMGQLEQAWARFEAGRSLIAPTGSVILEMMSALLEARLQLIGRDPERALDVLGRLREDARFSGYRFASELADTWRGLAHLMQDDASAAATALRQAVDSMRRGERILELPRAAVYLAEAEWQCGNEDAADAAARLAFETAQRQGTTHRLLQALVDTPAVAARAMDSEVSRDSGWHVLGRALISHDAPQVAPVEPEVLVKEFGGIKLLLGDAELKPRIKKTGELVAYLLSRDRPRASRHQLLEALFGGRDDRSTRAYLRQAIAQLRSVLPESVPLSVGTDEIALRDTSVIASESRRIEALLSRARRQDGERRLETLRLAVTIASAGDYLPGVEARWAEERRDFLAEIINDARLDLADLLYHHGHYSESCKFLEAAIKHDPYSERAWRLQMSLSAAVGDVDGVVEAFKHCRDRLAELALAPSAETLQLVERLRA